MKIKEIKKAVKKRYAKFARDNISYCPTCNSAKNNITKQAESIGYSANELKSIPESAVLGLGCGNPTALAELKNGEIVLDLGSGAGIDVFLAANKVGESGHVIGVDMTEEMIKRAEKIAEDNNYKNVEFRVGEIENLPVKNNTIDVIISNCVINLSPDKLQTFKEAFRVLKSGGRLMVSDLVTEGFLPEDIKKSFDAWSECVAGALEKNQYLDTIKKAGFHNVEIISQNRYSEKEMDDRLTGKITSIKVRAYK
ncbi:arsenite S-adenosylmethyltransferase [Thermoplasmatales archaeon SM1-50]|nr:MAG: arsenite S-adenosylmethyltransferase [Thermoplasmatales archaeon SM1-50]